MERLEKIVDRNAAIAQSIKEKVENRNVSVMQSIKTRVAIMVAIAIALATVFNLVVIIPFVSNIIENQNKSYLHDVADANGLTLEILLSLRGKESALGYEALSEVFNGVGIDGIDSSYAYVVAADGTMLYHPTEDKVGQPVENALVSGLVKDVSKGIWSESKVVDYDFKGVTKYASYYITNDCSAIIVITADEDEIRESVATVTAVCSGVGAAAIVIFVIAAYIIASIMLKPITKITEVLGRMSELDFTECEGVDKVALRKDEMGVIIRAAVELRDALVTMVNDVKQQSSELLMASENLNANAQGTAATMEQVEKAMSDIANGATNQAQETQAATENVIVMGSMIEDTAGEVSTLKVNADGMKKTSEEAQNILNKLISENDKTKESIDEIYRQTNTTNESAMKIKEATAIITSIADETNLLSLNASIEAARAGEQGRGFAVVAAQIQKLAEQSSESARRIEEITNMLINDSTRAVETMQVVKTNIGEQSDRMIQTDKMFATFNSGVIASIEGVDHIAVKTDNLDNSRVKVVDLVQSLSAIAEENAASSQETSASVTQISDIVTDISDNANTLRNISVELNEIIDVFKV